MTTKQEPNCFAASVKGPLVVPEASGGCEAMRPRRLHGQQIGPTLKALRQDRQDRGKPGKLARTACARKRRTIGNAMFRDGTAHADARAR